MAYIGRGLDKGNYLKLDDLQSQFNGSTTTFNLTSGGTAFYPGSAFSILVSVAGIVQEPESAYQINQNQIIFATAPLSSDDFFCIVLGVPLAVGVAGNSTITGTQLSKPFNYNDGHLFFDSVNNRLGINSTTPRQELDVRGNAIISGIITATSAIIGSGVTITSSGILASAGVITATSFVGDGSSLTGVSGFATALSATQTSPLNQIFKIAKTLTIGAGTSVSVAVGSDEGNVAFTRASNVVVSSGATFTIVSGTTLITNVLNVF